MSNPTQPIYFMVPFWGKRYLDYFTDCLLPSLGPQMGPGDRWIIACPFEDYVELVNSGLIDTHRVLWEQIKDVNTATAPRGTAALLQQNIAQTRLVKRAFKEGGYGCLLSPDNIVSNNFVATLRRAAADGYELVLYTALRQDEDKVFAEIGARRDLSAREVASLNVRHLHSELLPFEEGHPAQPWLPPLRWWRHGAGMIIHAYISAPVLMDYRSLKRHNIDCLKTQQLENIYLDRNFRHAKTLLITDSDDLGIISLAQDYPSIWTKRRNRPRWWKALGLQMSQYLWPRYGRGSFQTPAYWHLGKLQPIEATRQACQLRLDPISMVLGLAARWYLFHFRPWCARQPWIKKPYRAFIPKREPV